MYPKLQQEKKKKALTREGNSESTKQISMQHIPILSYKGFLTVMGQESCLLSKRLD